MKIAERSVRETVKKRKRGDLFLERDKKNAKLKPSATPAGAA